MMKKLLFTILMGLSSMITFSHPGTGIVMDSKGNVYYTDLTQVWKINTQGKKSVVVRQVHTHELYIDEHDVLYGEHLWYNGEAKNTWGHYVWRYRPNGTLEKIIQDKTGFRTDYSFTQDHHGNMFLPNREHDCQHIDILRTDGSRRALHQACLDNIREITLASDGTVYLVDLFSVKKISPAGVVTTLAADLQEKSLTQLMVNDSHQLMGITTDGKGNVLVASYGARKVKRISAEGRVSTVVQTNIGWSPTGVLQSASGDLWILECSPTNAVRVERITADGKRIIY
jgi:hypothetical protein